MKAPAFQFYAQDFLVGTADMTAEEVGAYIRLLAYQWVKEGLPNDDRKLMQLSGITDPNVLASVRVKFGLYNSNDNLIYNERLEAIRAEQDAFRKKQAENGSKGGNPNFKKGVPNPYYNPKDNPPDNPEINPSSSPSSSNNKDTINTEALPPVVPSKAEVSLKSVLPEIKTDPVPKPDKPATFEDKYAYFIQIMNELMGRKFKGCAPSKSNLKARLKEGYTSKDFKKAIENCLADPYHKANPNYLTPEFITRPDKLERYLNAVPIPEEFIETGAGIVKHTDEELENRFGEKREGFVQRDYTQPGFKPLLKAV